MKPDPFWRRAFTLIELLVVILIIVLLISILLPALKHAREAGRTVVCMSNMKQIATAIHGYANDYKGAIVETGNPLPVLRFWYGQPTDPRLANTGTGGTNPIIIGPIYEYLTYTDRAFECPTNKRRTPARAEVPGTDPMWNTPQNQLQIALFNSFLTPRAMNFDYTMVTGASGARIDASAQVAWDKSCVTRTAQAARPTPTTNNLVYMRSLPVFMEEDVEWWNSRSPDGMFSNWDQLTDRHGGKGHITYLNGDVEIFRFPRGRDPLSQNDIGDWAGNDIWARGRGANWYQAAPTWPGTPRPFGWFNSPRP